MTPSTACYGHWHVRYQIGLRGQMPVDPALPKQWYDAPNFHLCTPQVSETLRREHNIDILERRAVNHAHKSSLGPRLLSNLPGEIALHRFTRRVKAD